MARRIRRKYSPNVCTGIEKKVVCGDPDPREISTSYVERQNLTMRMGMRRFTRLTNGFSEKVENLAHAVSLHYMHYNFARSPVAHDHARGRYVDEADPGDGGWRCRSRLDAARDRRAARFKLTHYRKSTIVDGVIFVSNHQSSRLRRRAPAALVLSLVVAATAAAPAPAAGARAPKGAVVAAFERAVFHYAVPEKIRVEFTLRSRVDRLWSLVTGQYGRRGLWAAWVRRTASGRYRVETFRTRDFDPGTTPPCDLRPAFSEPLC
jgi:hypothetical protein